MAPSAEKKSSAYSGFGCAPTNRMPTPLELMKFEERDKIEAQKKLVFEEKRREGDKCWKAWTLDYDGRVKEKRGEDPPEDPEIVKARKEKETAEKEQAAAEAFKAWEAQKAKELRRKKREMRKILADDAKRKTELEAEINKIRTARNMKSSTLPKIDGSNSSTAGSSAGGSVTGSRFSGSAASRRTGNMSRAAVNMALYDVATSPYNVHPGSKYAKMHMRKKDKAQLARLSKLLEGGAPGPASLTALDNFERLIEEGRRTAGLLGKDFLVSPPRQVDSADRTGMGKSNFVSLETPESTGYEMAGTSPTTREVHVADDSSTYSDASFAADSPEKRSVGRATPSSPSLRKKHSSEYERFGTPDTSLFQEDAGTQPKGAERALSVRPSLHKKHSSEYERFATPDLTLFQEDDGALVSTVPPPKAKPPVAKGSNPEDSVSAWLNKVELGFGESFSGALRELGVEDADDLAAMDDEALGDVEEALQSEGGASEAQVAKVVAAIKATR
mmetsp:Transcript_108051/g.314298  ORF Transcript_108051/g.314298 Transcript_108051/m.314298 type:complete len:502 (+) Transcript_108051:127-1632(+)